MIDRPLVSIIIPVYNGAAYVSEAIRSALGQTYQHIEVIVIDDGSTDGTGRIVQAFCADSRLKYFFQENRGLAGARNAGIQKSGGEYVSFLDADDTYYPDKIEHMLGWRHEDNRASVYCCISDIVFEHMPEKRFVFTGMKIPEGSIGAGEMKHMLERGNFINVNTALVARSVFVSGIFFDESIRTSEDWDFWIRIALSDSSFFFRHELLVTTRMRKDSLQSNTTMQKRNNIYVYEKNFGKAPLSLKCQLILAKVFDLLPAFLRRPLSNVLRHRSKYSLHTPA